MNNQILLFSTFLIFISFLPSDAQNYTKCDNGGEVKNGRLKGIPHVLSPNLFHVLMSMGHGDWIVLADDNFPAASNAKGGPNAEAGPREIRADGHGIPDLLEAIMKFFSLNTHDGPPVLLMDPVPKDKKKGLVEPPVWKIYQQILNDAEKKTVPVKKLERFNFYKAAKRSYAVVATGEKAAYGNIILQKGVVL